MGDRAPEFCDSPGPEVVGSRLQGHEPAFEHPFPVGHQGDVAPVLPVEGRDKAGTVRLVTDYLARYRGIVVHVLGVHPGAIGADGRAEVECEVALSHGAAEILRKLIRIGSEYYRFRFELRKDAAGEWRFAYAEWEAAALTDLFPESLDILRKLFPDL